MTFKLKVGLLTLSIIILFYFTFFYVPKNEVPVVKVNDKDLIIENRLFSPNRKYVVYSYIFDTGALDYTRVFHSLAETKDTLTQINQFEIPCKDFPQCFHPIKWQNDSTLIISTKLSDFEYYGIKTDTTKFTLKQEIIKWKNVKIIGKFYIKSTD